MKEMAPTVLLDAWATAMWRACWQGGLLVLVVWSLCRIIPSMPARFQCWFWRLALLKFMMVLLCPTLLNLPLLPAPPVATPIAEVGLQVATEMPEMPVGPVDQVESDRTRRLSCRVFRRSWVSLGSSGPVGLWLGCWWLGEGRDNCKTRATVSPARRCSNN